MVRLFGQGVEDPEALKLQHVASVLQVAHRERSGIVGNKAIGASLRADSYDVMLNHIQVECAHQVTYITQST